MTQSLLLVHKGSDGITVALPFAYKDGNLAPVVEQIADYVVGMGLVDSFWEGIAADRLRTILENRMRIAALGEVIDHQRELIAAYKDKLGPLIMEAASA